MDRKCDDCGLPISVCNAEAMIRDARSRGHEIPEIARLQAEVERLTKGLEFWTSDHDKRWVDQMKRADATEAKLLTAWNDAIEAAAASAERSYGGLIDSASIRALRKQP